MFNAQEFIKSPHFLQSANWARTRQAIGERVKLGTGGFIRIKDTPAPFKDLGYIEQADLQKLNLSRLIVSGKKLGLSHIQIDPYNIVSWQVDGQDAHIVEQPKHPDEHNQPRLHPTSSVFHRHTLLIDLSLSEDQLLAQMKSKTRYNSLLGLKKGVKVEVVTDHHSFEQFLRLHRETANRQNYFARSDAYLTQVWKSLSPLGKAKIATASFNGQILVAWMLLLGEDVLYYPYGGSSETYRELMPASALVWELIRWAKHQGFKYFDLWGTDPDMPGVRRFKTGYGGIEITYAPAVDLIISPFWYYAFKLANNIRWMGLRMKRFTTR